MDRIKKIKKVFLIVILSILSACSGKDRIEILKDNVFKFIPEDYMVDDVSIEKWKTGKNFASVISKGITITLTMPELSNNDARLLWESRKVDSWFIKVSRIGHMGRQQLTQMAVPYGSIKRGEFSKGRITKISYSVYYAAASISIRLSNLQCPALNHRKLINNVEVRNNHVSLKSIHVGASEEFPINDQYENLSFGKLVLNGSSTLKGTYNAEIAFFSSVEKRIKSSFIDFPQSIIIGHEEEVDLPGCLYEDVPQLDPNDKSKENNIDQFKFGR